MGRKKVLLVDGSATVILMERVALAPGNYQIFVASDGDEALHAAVAHRPDLILLGVALPEMDGFEVCRRLRARDETRETPILLVTTRSEEGSLQKGREAGCDDYVLKPINATELQRKVRYLLGD